MVETVDGISEKMVMEFTGHVMANAHHHHHREPRLDRAAAERVAKHLAEVEPARAVVPKSRIRKLSGQNPRGGEGKAPGRVPNYSESQVEPMRIELTTS